MQHLTKAKMLLLEIVQSKTNKRHERKKPKRERFFHKKLLKAEDLRTLST